MKSQAQVLTLMVVALAMAAKAAIAQSVEDRSLGAGSIVQLAGQEAVQKDLMVSDEVASKLKSLAQEFQQAAAKVNQELGIKSYNPNILSAEERDKYANHAKSINAQFVPRVTELLSSDQLQRLRQIQFQLPFGAGAHQALVIPNVASALELSDDQLATLNMLLTEYRQKIASRQPTKGSPADYPKFKREYDDLRQKLRDDYSTQAMKTLSSTQKEKLESLAGAPFDVSQLERR